MRSRILGIETSCDETAAAVVDVEGGRFIIRADKVLSQIELHRLYGGVVPELASREHLRALPLMVEEALKEAKTCLEECDAVAVTCGPGLKGCLLIGTGYARGLTVATGIPLIEVNHIEAHVHAAFLTPSPPELPFLALVASGGHTEIVLVRGLGSYEIIARTTDDAAGEAFDKAANLLQLPYPGGPSLSALAGKADRQRGEEIYRRLPKVMRDQPNFSFSGLKTAIALLVRKEKEAMGSDESLRSAVAWAVQESIVEALVGKAERASSECRVPRLFVTGGVAANSRLRERLSASKEVQALFPDFSLCVDNAVMVAALGGARFLGGQRAEKRGEIFSRWPIESCTAPAGER